MDDLTFSARRASTLASMKTAEPADLDTRFRSLVQSPLRAGLLRYISARPDESFDVEQLMQTFGRCAWTSENCVKEPPTSASRRSCPRASLSTRPSAPDEPTASCSTISSNAARRSPPNYQSPSVSASAR